MYYVYILKWEKYYIWYTSNIEQRLLRHKLWLCITTKRLKIHKLIWYFEKDTKTEAMKLEKMIKKNWHIKHWINHTSFIKSHTIIN